MAVKWHRLHGRNVSQTAREFEVDRKRIREWERNFDELAKHDVGASKKKRKLHQGREVASKELDASLFSYLEEERAKGNSVSNKELRARGKEIAGGLQMQGFAASSKWLWRWK